jgi:hypothetical protein
MNEEITTELGISTTKENNQQKKELGEKKVTLSNVEIREERLL